MKLTDLPARFPIPFASAAGGGYITYPLPEASQIGVTDGRASLSDGYPPLNFLPVGAGGVPPFGQDTNGILKQITLWSRWQGAGGSVPFNSSFAASIGGYPRNAIVSANAFTGFYISTVDDNTADPNAGGANWLPFFPYPQEVLSANRTYYISTTGSDSNDGLTPGAAWATLQHAWDFLQQNVNLAGFTATIQIANGTYTDNLVANGSITGSTGAGSVMFLGNIGSPTSVSYSSTDYVFLAQNGAVFSLDGISASSSGATSAVVQAANQSTIFLQRMAFGATTYVHIAAGFGGTIGIAGSYTITGNATYHLYSYNLGNIRGEGSGLKTVTLTGTPAFTRFATARMSAIIDMNSAYISYVGSAVGSRYLAELLGNILTNGGANFFPGSTAGGLATSGIYN